MARFILFLLATLFALTQAHPSPTDGALIVQAAASPFLRGVNLGGWLVLEPFLTPELFAANGAVDQWTFDQQAGSENVLRHHWDTFCTEADIQKLASYGVNACVIQSLDPTGMRRDLYTDLPPGFASASASGLTTTPVPRIIRAPTHI